MVDKDKIIKWLDGRKEQLESMAYTPEVVHNLQEIYHLAQLIKAGKFDVDVW